MMAYAQKWYFFLLVGVAQMDVFICMNGGGGGGGAEEFTAWALCRARLFKKDLSQSEYLLLGLLCWQQY
jgi:hypothetical protein